METIQHEIKLAQVESDIKLVRGLIVSLEELNEIKYIDSYAFKQGILKAKAHLCDLLVAQRDSEHSIKLVLNS